MAIRPSLGKAGITLALNLDSVASTQRPTIIGVGGLTSNVGKTTLLCELLGAFPDWEAIKTTRGHYRSCGKDPHTCCVSDLLDAEPVIRSGREQTYSAGKDTGRYWDAGASNVHWVIATEEQIARGIHVAMSRVRSKGVLIEGNSFSEYTSPDFFVMVARPDDVRIKASAKKALRRVSALYFSSEIQPGDLRNFQARIQPGSSEYLHNIPVYTPESLPLLISTLRACRDSHEANSSRQTPVEIAASYAVG